METRGSFCAKNKWKRNVASHTKSEDATLRPKESAPIDWGPGNLIRGLACVRGGGCTPEQRAQP